MSALLDALDWFAAAYAACPAVVAEQKGWTRTIALVASDTGATARATLDDGRIIALDEGCGGDVVIRATQDTLCDVLELRRSPDGPYLFGDLLVEGDEADFTRLDYIMSLLPLPARRGEAPTSLLPLPARRGEGGGEGSS